ncbi:MAG: hypothetical protein LBL87_07110 [Ruminococcus sp.]|jgi:hypothetical protein|nr:hypothetical protein [Ruminococcus sp.]
MNRNFHWYAVSTILSDPALFGTERNADLYKDEAYKIAYFSQFIDDYNLYVPFLVSDSDIPAEAEFFRTSDGFINPVTTGFNSLPPDDLLNLMNPRDYYKKVVIPFHFMPNYSLADITRHPSETKDADATTYSVKPLDLTAPAAAGTVLGGLMEKAKAAYKNSTADTTARNKAVVLIGMLLHIFADTYAHEHFNGFRSDHNYVDVKQVRHYEGDLSQFDHNTKLGRVWSSVKTWSTEAAVPKVGHGMAGHEPDYNNGICDYYFTRRGGNTPEVRLHNGYNISLDCAFQIYNYLRECLKLPTVLRNSDEWTRLSAELSHGFLMDYQIGDTDSKQKERWHRIARIRDLNLDYNKGFIFAKMKDDKGNENPSLSWRQFFTATFASSSDLAKFPVTINNPDFWYFNFFAYSIRNAVNGSRSAAPSVETYLAS